MFTVYIQRVVSPWLVFSVGMFWPGMGQIFIGQGYKGICITLLALFLQVAFSIATVPFGEFHPGFYWAFLFLVNGIFAAEAFVLAKHVRKGFVVGRWATVFNMGTSTTPEQLPRREKPPQRELTPEQKELKLIRIGVFTLVGALVGYLVSVALFG